MKYIFHHPERNSILFIAIIYLVGIAGHIIPDTREFFISLTPYSILITGGLTLFISVRNANKKFIYWLIFTLIFTFSLEVVGAKTGLIFGNYSYSEILGVTLLDVPVIISLNWVLIILGAASTVSGLNLNVFRTSFLAAGTGTLFDFFLEKIAISFNYWYWDNDTVPLQNYAAWFIIIYISTLILLKLNPKFSTGISREYLLIQLFFLIVLSSVVG